MTTLSQKNLLTLAQENEANGKLDLAIQNVEEALLIGSNKEIVLRLCDLYLKADQASSAYSLIKEEKDLFSDDEIFFAYSRVLQANHFLIEALEIKNLSKGEKEVEVLPASISEQQATMEKFRLSKNPTKYEYDQLFTLHLISLYPKLSKYVEEPDSFASDIASYIDFQDGRSHHDLFRQIDHNLPK